MLMEIAIATMAWGEVLSRLFAYGLGKEKINWRWVRPNTIY